MAKKKYVFDRESALKEMKDKSRSLVTPEYAASLIEPFVPFAKVKITKNIGKPFQQRITWSPGMTEGVGVDDISMEIVKMLGEEPHTPRPYMGTGRNAEHRTMTNLAIICAKLKIKNKDCDEIMEWIFPKDRSWIEGRFSRGLPELKDKIDKLEEVV